jgi:hypothetical protein
MGKKEFNGFDDLFFWGREPGRLYSLDDYVVHELEGDKTFQTEWGDDRNLLTIQRVLIRELIEAKILTMNITIFGAQAWFYNAKFDDEIEIQNEPKNNYSPLWIWWPEFTTVLSDIPTPEVFQTQENFDAYNENYLTPDRKSILPGGSEIWVRPSLPGVWERSEKMMWENLSDSRKSEFMDFLLGVLFETCANTIAGS